MTVMTVPVTTGGKKRMNRAKNGAMRNATTPPTMHGPIDRPQAGHAAVLCQSDGDHRAHRRERHTLQQRKPHADLPEPDGLDQRGDAAGKQVGVDEERQLVLRQPDRVREQDRDDDRTRVERKHMLEAVQRELRHGQDLVDRVLAGHPPATGAGRWLRSSRRLLVVGRVFRRCGRMDGDPVRGGSGPWSTSVGRWASVKASS